MAIKINSTTSTKIVNQLLTLLTRNNPIPVIESIYIDEKNIVATNLETRISIPHSLKLQFPKNRKNKAMLIPIKDWKTITEGWDDGNFSVDSAKEEIIFTSNKDRVSFDSIAPEEFPTINKFSLTNENLVGEINQDIIDQMILASNYMGVDDLRPIMSHIFLHDDIVATDAHRMYFEKLKSPMKTPVLINKIVFSLFQLIGGNWKVYKNSKDEPLIFIEESGIEIYTRVFDGIFPNYIAVIPDEKNLLHSCNVDRKLIVDALKKCLKFCNKTTYQVAFKFIKDGIRLSTSDFDFGKEFKTEIGSENIGDIEIGFNAKFLLSYLEETKDVYVNFKMEASNRACIINKKFLIMPVMLYKEK